MATMNKIEKVTRYVLELSYDEAQALADVLSCVAGSPTTTRRMYTIMILHELSKAGIGWQSRG